jgi:hypothetical protein
MPCFGTDISGEFWFRNSSSQVVITSRNIIKKLRGLMVRINVRNNHFRSQLPFNKFSVTVPSVANGRKSMILALGSNFCIRSHQYFKKDTTCSFSL